MLEFFSFLPYLFFVVLGLHCCAGFSLVAAIGGVCVWGGGGWGLETLFFVAGVQASSFIGFSCCRALGLGSQASGVAAHGCRDLVAG